MGRGEGGEVGVGEVASGGTGKWVGERGKGRGECERGADSPVRHYEKDCQTDERRSSKGHNR